MTNYEIPESTRWHDDSWNYQLGTLQATVGYELEPLRHVLTPALKDAGLVAWTISWERLFHIGIGLVRGKMENLKVSVRAGRWLNFISCDGWNYARDWPGSGWARPCIACVLVPFRKRPVSLLIAPRNQIQSAPVQFRRKILNKYHQESTLSFCNHALKLEKVGPRLQVQSMSILAMVGLLFSELKFCAKRFRFLKKITTITNSTNYNVKHYRSHCVLDINLFLNSKHCEINKTNWQLTK